MRLTSYTDFTLRTLIYLGLTQDRLATIGEVSQRYGIAETHLMKVVHQLGIAGDIETIRGKGGGLRLGRRPEAINIGAVVRRTEPDLVLVPCFSDSGACTIEPGCVLQTALRRALAAFVAELDRYTLADLIAPRMQLMELLRLAAPQADATATGDGLPDRRPARRPATKPPVPGARLTQRRARASRS